MRAFIAIKVQPSPAIEKLISEIEKTNCANVVRPHNLHFCLDFLGEIDDLQVENVKKALDTLAGFGKFEAKLKSVDAFPNQNFIKILWIGAESEKLIELAEKLKGELQKYGFGTEKFTPHVTVARVKKKLDKNFISSEEFKTQEVDKVYLIASELTRSGPVYRDVYEVKL